MHEKGSSMKKKNFIICFFLVSFLSLNSRAFADSTMTLEVKGKITQGGNPVGAGYKVSIINTRTNQTLTTTTPSATGPGTYANAWVDFLNPVAKTGDVIRVEVKSVDGQKTLNTATSTYSSGTSITVNLTIPVPANNPPQASDQTVTTTEEVAVSIILLAQDADGGSLTYSVISDPSQGRLSGVAPNLTYTPKSNFNGTDTFTFKANDGSADSSAATVAVTVSAVNDAPVAIPQVVITSQNAAKSITLVGIDVDNDNSSLTYKIGQSSKNGTLSTISGTTVTYTPNRGFSGGDSFSFKVNDGKLDSSVATVTIVVTAINNAPVATDQSVTVAADSSNNSITLSGSDSEGDNLTYTLVSNPSQGKLSGTAPNLTYAPKAGFSGSDSFTFKANDGTADSNVATVSITVNSVNDAPVANAQSVTTNEDTAKSINLSASDADGNALTYVVVSQPGNGTLSGTAPSLTYAPKAGFSGSDSFTFKANDGKTDSSIATVSIAVQATPKPQISLSTSQLNLGDIELGQSKSSSLAVSNSGTATLVVSSISSNSNLVSVSPSLLSVNAGQSQSITITSIPQSEGAVSAVVTIVSNAGTSTVSVSATGKPLPPKISLSRTCRSQWR